MYEDIINSLRKYSKFKLTWIINSLLEEGLVDLSDIVKVYLTQLEKSRETEKRHYLQLKEFATEICKAETKSDECSYITRLMNYMTRYNLADFSDEEIQNKLHRIYK